jgi:hypothetical protein
MLRSSTVSFEIRRADDQSRAETDSLGHGHGRTDAKTPRRIRTRRDHTAGIRSSANSKSSPAQAGIEVFFDRAEEGIKIEVQDFPGHGGAVHVLIVNQYSAF